MKTTNAKAQTLALARIAEAEALASKILTDLARERCAIEYGTEHADYATAGDAGRITEDLKNIASYRRLIDSEHGPAKVGA